jgi:hypothetical protein
MIGFDDTSYLVLLRTNHGLQKDLQIMESLRGMIDSARTDLTARFINDHDVMVGICPINTSKPHGRNPFAEGAFLDEKLNLLKSVEP